eukprot:CAMPEP_0194270186 /NCGR_PEP_ID=MMETSP0169-20130528/4229_1 /TAXON_ID=218684 /ORGANISM="Corethron pennatum, Strain L29A3" /LENGTH=354 /DNA_ID=CAMNT_0039012141 /DNA_START=84 /DNA_END=1148 /DNA_ORIENTATION=+
MSAATSSTPSSSSGSAAVLSAPPQQPLTATYEQPWVEKYRPHSLDDVVGNDETLSRLRSIADDGNCPNLILCGPPGTGKTSSVHALARGLLGPEGYKSGVLELNASDARGIDVVRTRIKMFAQNRASVPAGRHKFVILDEADSMTGAAQQALRRTMEIYSNTTRFALACNISTKIIEPIQSRAAILRFGRLTDGQILKRVLHVCDAEGVPHTEDGLEAVVFTSEGDMRNALNNLQSTHAGFGSVCAVNVYKVCDAPHPTAIRAALDACAAGKTREACAGIKKLFDAGYGCADIVGTMFRVCKGHEAMSESVKLEFLREVGFAHMRIADGCTTLLQLLGLVARLSRRAEEARKKN